MLPLRDHGGAGNILSTKQVRTIHKRTYLFEEPDTEENKVLQSREQVFNNYTYVCTNLYNTLTS